MGGEIRRNDGRGGRVKEMRGNYERGIRGIEIKRDREVGEVRGKEGKREKGRAGK